MTPTPTPTATLGPPVRLTRPPTALPARPVHTSQMTAVPFGAADLGSGRDITSAYGVLEGVLLLVAMTVLVIVALRAR